MAVLVLAFSCCPTLPLMSPSSPTDGSPRSQVCVVTGANSGIGRATAVHLAESGYAVVGTVRSRAKADKLNAAAEAAGVAVDLVEIDIADDDSVHAGFTEILERAGRVDHLVNNAGVGGNGVVEETTPERMLEVLNVDLCGGTRMPKLNALPTAQIEAITDWICIGAPNN